MDRNICGFCYKSKKYGKVVNKEQLVNTACELYEKGFSAREVSEIVGVSKATILNWLKNKNIHKRSKRKYTYDFVMQLGELYENPNYTAKELSNMFDIDVDIVKYLLSKYGFSKNGNRVKVAQIDPNGNVVNTFNSLTDASKAMQVTIPAISRVYDTERTCKGYKWKTLGGKQDEQSN